MPIRRSARLIPQHRFREVYFGHTSTVLTPRYRIRLRAHARYLAKNPQLVVALVGHRDLSEAGVLPTRLGRRRAAAVRDFLVHLGVERKRLTVASFADRMPLKLAFGHAVGANRRVDLIYFGEPSSGARGAGVRRRGSG